jgi:hypothetical protein
MFCCKKAARLLSESFDRKLSLWERVSLRVHVVICRFCRCFHQDMQRFDDALRKYSQEIDADRGLTDVSLQPEARQRILQAMEKEM